MKYFFVLGITLLAAQHATSSPGTNSKVAFQNLENSLAVTDTSPVELTEASEIFIAERLIAELYRGEEFRPYSEDVFFNYSEVVVETFSGPRDSINYRFHFYTDFGVGDDHTCKYEISVAIQGLNYADSLRCITGDVDNAQVAVQSNSTALSFESQELKREILSLHPAYEDFQLWIGNDE